MSGLTDDDWKRINEIVDANDNADEEKATSLLKKALEDYHNNVDVLYRLGCLACNIRMPEIAKEAFDQVLAIDENHFETLHTLGEFYLEYEDDIFKAKEYLEKALEVEPDDSNTQYDLNQLDMKLWKKCQEGLVNGELEPACYLDMARKSLHQVDADEIVTTAITKLLALLKVYPIIDDYETIRVAHYTDAKVALGHITKNTSHLWLFTTTHMNDSWEGLTFYKYLGIKPPNNQDIPLTPFIACFTFALKLLNQFRLYGKTDHRESSGISFEFQDTFFADSMTYGGKDNKEHDYKLTLFRCVYVNPDKKVLAGIAQIDRHTLACHNQLKDDLLVEYKAKNAEIEKQVATQLTIIKDRLVDLNKTEIKMLAPWLAYITPLIKHADYHEEQECRLVRMLNPNQLPNDVVIKTLENEKKEIRTYIEYDPPIMKHVTNIIVGTHSHLDLKDVQGYVEKHSSMIPVTQHDCPHKG